MRGRQITENYEQTNIVNTKGFQQIDGWTDTYGMNSRDPKMVCEIYTILFETMELYAN